MKKVLVLCLVALFAVSAFATVASAKKVDKARAGKPAKKKGLFGRLKASLGNKIGSAGQGLWQGAAPGGGFDEPDEEDDLDDEEDDMEDEDLDDDDDLDDEEDEDDLDDEEDLDDEDEEDEDLDDEDEDEDDDLEDDDDEDEEEDDDD